jgi:hypothetical protein
MRTLQQQQQLHQQQNQELEQYLQFQQSINELVDLPELIPIQNNLEDMTKTHNGNCMAELLN